MLGWRSVTFAKEIRLAYAAHQRLLRLDFEADHIFTGVNGGRIVVSLHIPQRDPFNIVCCNTKMTYRQYATAWSEFIEAVQVKKLVSQAELDAMYDEWPFGDTNLVLALADKNLLTHQRARMA